MVISVSKTLTHKAPAGQKVQCNQAEIKSKVDDLVKRIGLTSDQMQWSEDGNLILKKADNLKLHTLMLQMEESGLDLRMTKQTLIEVG
jgi:hypothetical protein